LFFFVSIGKKGTGSVLGKLALKWSGTKKDHEKEGGRGKSEAGIGPWNKILVDKEAAAW